MKNKGIRSLAKNASYLFASHGLTNLVRGCYAFFLAYYLGAEFYGVYSYGMSWYLAFLPLTYFGHEVIVRREIGRRPHDPDKISSHTLLIRFFAAILTAVLSAFFAISFEENELIKNLLFIFSIALIGRTLSIWADILFSSYEKSRVAFFQNSIFRLLEVVCGIGILLKGGGVLFLAALHCLSWWLQAILSLAIVRRRFVSLSFSLRKDKLALLLKAGVILGFLSILETWFIQGPVIMFRFLDQDTSELGALALAMQAFLILLGIPWAIGNASLPILARTVDRQDNKELLFMEVLIKVGCIFGVAAGLGGFSLGPIVVDYIFGASFDKTGELLGVGFWILMPGVWLTASTQVLHAHEKTFAVFTGLILGVALLVIATFFWVERYGSVGSLYALGVGMMMSSIVMLIWLSRVIRFNFVRSILRQVISMTPCFFVPFIGEKGWSQFGLGITVLLLVTYFLSLTRKERRLFHSRLSHRIFQKT